MLIETKGHDIIKEVNTLEICDNYKFTCTTKRKNIKNAKIYFMIKKWKIYKNNTSTDFNSIFY